MLEALFLYMIYCFVIVELGPPLFEGLCLLIVFVCRCLVVAAGALLFGLWKASS